MKAEAVEPAQRAGLNVAATQSIGYLDHGVLLVERFDRTPKPGEWTTCCTDLWPHLDEPGRCEVVVESEGVL